MKNVILCRTEYQTFREYLHRSEATWRDCGQSVIVPAWGECIANKEICYGKQTATQIAYTTLKTHYPALRLKWRKDELRLLELNAPKLFLGRFEGDLFYVDIKSAFAQFYQHLFLHSEYPFKRQKYPLRSLAEELWDRKIARNCLVGICRSTHNKWSSKGKVWYVEKINNYLSPPLWAQLMGLLDQIAQKMEKIGAIWINTDGYLFSSHRKYREAIWWLLDQGIVIKHGCGPGYIRALQNIQVEGIKELRSTDVGRKPIRHIEQLNYDFLKQWRKNRDRK